MGDEMEFRTITTFIKAAELESFSRAAEQLGYSQSAVTVQIKQLEGELGVPLFERIGKRVRLTEAGNRFLGTALQIMREMDAVRDSLGSPNQIKGSLRIATAESMLISILPPVFLKFKQQCPEVPIRTKTGTISELFEMIRQNDIDLLFFLDKKVRFPEWCHVLEQQERIVFAASTANELAGQRRIPMERLLEQPFLLTEKSISYRLDLEQALAARGLEVEPFLETGNTQVIAGLLLENAGVSFLPEYVVRPYVAEGTLQILDVDFPEISMWSQLVYHKNKWVTPQMRIFMEILQNHLEQEPKR